MESGCSKEMKLPSVMKHKLMLIGQNVAVVLLFDLG